MKLFLYQISHVWSCDGEVGGNFKIFSKNQSRNLDVSGGPQPIAFLPKVGHSEALTGGPILLSPRHQVREVVLPAALKHNGHA